MAYHKNLSLFPVHIREKYRLERRPKLHICPICHVIYARQGGEIACSPSCRLLARFWSYVTKSEGCWLWTGATTRGYGYLRGNMTTKNIYAHRLSYELHIGTIPDGLVLDHLCRNTLCVNPEHLEPVTNKENILRGMTLIAQNKRKTHCLYGHQFSDDNTYVNKHGDRDCIICRRRRSREFHARKTAGKKHL
jgi:hypothetical protein